MNDNGWRTNKETGGKFNINDVDNFSRSKIQETLYHGTNENFENFSLDKFGKHDQGDFGKGLYFSLDKQTASKYGDIIKEVNVNIENPLEINTSEDYKKMWHDVALHIDTSRLNNEDLAIYNDKYIPQEDKDFMLYDSMTADEKKEIFKNMGYDGIIDKTYNQVVVFDEKQVKNKGGRRK